MDNLSIDSIDIKTNLYTIDFRRIHVHHSENINGN